MKGFGIGLILSSLFKGIGKLFNAIITLVAYVLIYFGLWVPCAYMLFILILQLSLGLDISAKGTDTILFYVGLLLSLGASLVVTIRNLLVKPISELNGRYARGKELKRRETISKATKLRKQNPKKYYQLYGNVPPNEIPSLSYKELKNKASAPMIYRSKRNQEIVIHEYQDRYEVFKDATGQLEYIETKRK